MEALAPVIWQHDAEITFAGIQIPVLKITTNFVQLPPNLGELLCQIAPVHSAAKGEYKIICFHAFG